MSWYLCEKRKSRTEINGTVIVSIRSMNEIKEHKKRIIRVLLVEDDKYLNEAIKSHLECEGYVVEQMFSYKDTKRVVKKNEKYDILMVDFKLTNSIGKTGIDVYEEIKAAYPGIKAIMVSGYGDYKVKKEAFKAGIDRFLDKPFFLEQLSFIITNLTEVL